MNFYLFCQYYTRFIAILLYFIAILLLEVVFFKLCFNVFFFINQHCFLSFACPIAGLQLSIGRLKLSVQRNF